LVKTSTNKNDDNQIITILRKMSTKQIKQCNKSEVSSSVSEDVDDDTSSTDVGDVDDVSDGCATDNPNSIACKLNKTLSKLEFPQADDKIDTTDSNRCLDK
jgi:hypothetical protein